MAGHPEPVGLKVRRLPARQASCRQENPGAKCGHSPSLLECVAAGFGRLGCWRDLRASETAGLLSQLFRTMLTMGQPIPRFGPLKSNSATAPAP